MQIMLKLSICKKRPLLGNTSKNNTVLCNHFLGNGSINTVTLTELLLETEFSVRSVQNGHKEDNLWQTNYT
jgi:hypothetical protein